MSRKTTYADVMRAIAEYRGVKFDSPFALENKDGVMYKITVNGVMANVNGGMFFFTNGIPAVMLNKEGYPLVKNDESKDKAVVSTRAVLTLIRAHAEKDEAWFKAESLLIADRLEEAGNDQAADFIRGVLDTIPTFEPM